MAITVTKEGIRWIARFPFSYETKDVVKAAGFRYSPAEKLWYTTDANIASRLDPETAQRAVAQANAAVAMSRAADTPVADIPAPEGLAYLPYQKVGIAYTLTRSACLIADEMGLGKGHPTDTKILTPHGWQELGTICPGDKVIGSAGKAITVTGVYPRGQLPIFEVIFNDETSVKVDDDHLWAVRTPQDKFMNRDYRVLSTRQLRQKVSVISGDRANKLWSIPLVQPIEFSPRLSTGNYLDPYILGVLLGDGSLAHDPVAFTPGDDRVPEEVRAVLPTGVNLMKHEAAGAATLWRMTSNPRGASNPVREAMRALGLVGLGSAERFIPKRYLFASVQDRISLLQGLCDTDGELRNDKHLEFHSTSYGLTMGVKFLVESLGGTACYKQTPITRYSYKGEWRTGLPCHGITINLPPNICPVRAQAYRWSAREKYLPNRMIKEIRPAGEAEVICISVDAPDQLYVTEHCIVTHNTIQAIGKINATATINKVLVVCPASLKINWARELNKWLVRPMSVGIVNGSFPTTDIVIINYDVLVRWRDTIDTIPWDLAIVDEAHYAKNPRAQRTQALFGKEEKVGGRYVMTKQPIKPRQWLMLTGTPIVNRPGELWPLVHTLDPNDIGQSFFGFMKRYTNAYHNGYAWDFSGAANLEELQQRMRAKFMVRRLKADVLTDLPAKRRQVITFDPDPDTRATIAAENEAYEDMVARLRAGIRISFEEMARVRHDTAVAKIPFVLSHIEEALESQDKVVVFVHHHDVVHAILNAYPGAAVVTGETPVGQRQLEVDKFQYDPDCHLFVGSIKAAGVGLTLTAAQLVIFAELDWVPGNVTQAEDRLHRIGQRGSVLVQHLVFDNSVDAKMAATIVAKQEIIEQGLDRPTRELVVPEALLQAAQEEANAPTHETESGEAGADAAEPIYDEIPF